MNPPDTWEIIAVGAVVVVVLFLFRPGLKETFRKSKEAENKDWTGVIVPLGLVVLFVILLLYLA